MWKKLFCKISQLSLSLSPLRKGAWHKTAVSEATALPSLSVQLPNSNVLLLFCISATLSEKKTKRNQEKFYWVHKRINNSLNCSISLELFQLWRLFDTSALKQSPLHWSPFGGELFIECLERFLEKYILEEFEKIINHSKCVSGREWRIISA